MLIIIYHQEMQIETTMKYHLTPVRTAQSKGSETSSVGRMWRKRSPHIILLVGMQTCIAPMKNSTNVSLNIEHGSTI